MYIHIYIYIYIYLCIDSFEDKSVQLVAGISESHRINMDLEIVESTGISLNHTALRLPPPLHQLGVIIDMIFFKLYFSMSWCPLSLVHG